MNTIENKLLWSEDKFIPETHLKQLRFAYKACGPFTKNKEKIKNLKKHNFQHDMAYEDLKDLNRATTTDKVLHDKTFNIAKNLKYDWNHCGLAWMIYKFFDKETSGRKANFNKQSNY